MKFRNFRLFTVMLTMLTVFVFLKRGTLDTQHLSADTATIIVKQGNVNDMSQLTQDDPSLISIIRDQYLVPPAGPTEKLNLVRKMWKSPVLQVVHKLLRNKTDGYFLECGAFDGESSSNTIELEQFNWQGVLVEADPNYKERLLGKHRKAWVAPICLSPQPHATKLRMVRHRTQETLAHIPELHPRTPSYSDDNFISFEVQCFPLYSVVVAALNRTEIDYLSLDVEGAEWQIIQTIPFEKLKIKVISLEVLQGARLKERYQIITEYLKSKGYVYQAQVEIPSQYIHDNVFAHQSIL